MEMAECTKVVLNRIEQFEPDAATKIIGYLLLNYTHEEIMEFAYGSDNLILNLINEAKVYISSSPNPLSSPTLLQASERPISAQYAPVVPTMSRAVSLSSKFRVQAPFVDPHLVYDRQAALKNLDFTALEHADIVGEDCQMPPEAEFMRIEKHVNQLNSFETEFMGNYYHPANTRSPTVIPEMPFKSCQYFYKGYCKHGINCRYLHGQTIADRAPEMHNVGFTEMACDDHMFSPSSLVKLELEIAELLRSRNGMPVSIASLPMLYLEKYGRMLQAEGYLTESQRHGKAGFSLTKLLARFRNSIYLIDRPHGQHSVVLTEDVPKYMEYNFRNERPDPGVFTSSAHQIYLTFPAESSFTEEDVSNYFKQFGPVHDVRIPRQEKRMFGFVSFIYPETVSLILSKGCPHYVCGARILVKPYKEKSQLIDRKCIEKLELPVHHPTQYLQMEPDLYPIPRVYHSSRILKRHLMEERERALEQLERRRLLELQLRPKLLTQASNVARRMDDLKLNGDNFCDLPISANNGTSSDGKPSQTSDEYDYQDGGNIELPDSPFASPCLGSNSSAEI